MLNLSLSYYLLFLCPCAPNKVLKLEFRNPQMGTCTRISKCSKQNASPKQEQPECNPTPMDPPERNPAEVEVNSVDTIPKTYSWSRLTELFSCSGKTLADPVPVSLP